MITHRISNSGYGVRGFTQDEIREAIFAVEGIISQGEQVKIEEDHFFSEGLYTRTIHIPKGTLFTGKLHAREDLLIIVSGDITIYTENGECRVKGFKVMKVSAGTKPLAFAHEDTIALNVHRNPDNLQDLDLLEEKLIIPNKLGELPQGGIQWLG